MHPAVHGSQQQSLAEAIVYPGERTSLHRHHRTEELYHFTAGEGRMTLEQECFAVRAGDTIHIPAGTAHCIANTGHIPLKVLCTCAPAYSDDDTHLI